MKEIKVDKDTLKEKANDARKKGTGFLNEFKKFVMRGNVVDMAVGVIIGAAFGTLITAFTDDFINPLINGIGGTEIAGQIKIYGGQALNWGHFLTSLINFLINAFVLFVILKSFNKLSSLGKKEDKKEEPKKSNEELLLEEIRDLLKEQNKAK